MSRINRPATLNRGVLGLVGVLLLAAGVFAVAAHFGKLSWVRSGDTVVPGTQAPPAWVLWVAVAVAVLIALLCLRWLLAQVFRMPKSVTWRTGGTEWPGTTVLESAVAAAPVATDIESYAGVRSASAWLCGDRTAPELHLVVTAEPNADIAELRRSILGHALTRLRTALEVEIIPVTLEIDFAEDRRPARVR
ncbi:alkaline shock response membrane anchor protein AmaP [Nocardia brasiliensis]|uniref:Alkaline shock response membrane anchor protein AmaP n=1 Tax=Nocardia brasiliensis TaxID=37326 RepID=A0A6G9XQ86_NOCBR|nr:alkaline shock response membrane anchor protein AmaP [Nocardia brasiliensis]QIS03112.1 alkaline shock response membrane anchor protein AmaP [Nocardia brasiliensis]